MATTEQLIIDARIQDGVSKSLKDIAKASAAMGASVDETRAAMTSLDKSATDLGIPLSKAKEAFKGLVKETEDATEATKHLGVTMRYQAATGINSTAAAAKDIGDLLGGGTRALRAFDAQAAAMADQIDKIKDPAKRAELAMKELERAIKRQNSPIQKLKNGLQEMKVGLTRLGPAATLVAGAASAAGAAIGGVLVASITKYLGSSAKMVKRQEAIKKAMDDFLYTLGGTVLESIKFDKALQLVGKALEYATKWVKSNQKTIAGWAKAVVSAGARVGEGLVFVLGGVAQFATITAEVMRDTLRFMAKFSGMGKTIQEGARNLATLKLISFEAMDEMTAFGKVLESFGEGSTFEFTATQKVSDGIEGIRKSLRGLRIDAENALDTDAPIKLDRRTKSGGAGGGGKKKEGAGFGSDAITNQIRATVKAGIAIQVQEAQLQRGLQNIRDGAREMALAWAEAGMSFDDLMQRQNALTFLGEVNNAMDRLTSSTLDMTIALADGTLQWRDLGNEIASQTGSILQESGKALAEYAIKSGAIFQAFGFSLEAMKSLSGIGLILAAGGLIAAGSVLARFGDTATPARQRASRGDSRAANELERLGRNLIERSSTEEGRTVVLNVDGYEIGGWMREQMIENERRGRTRRT